MMQTTNPAPARSVDARPQDSVGWTAWWPVVMMLGCSLLSYIDRQTLAVLSPVILADLKLNAEKYSEIISAFSLAYMLANPLWGSILDRIGLRRIDLRCLRCRGAAIDCARRHDRRDFRIGDRDLGN